MVYMYHSCLMYLSADGHVGCFHVLAMINSAAMNIGVHVSLSDLGSLVCMPRSGIHLSFDAHLNCFHILATVNSAAMNNGTKASFQISIFFSLDTYPGV